MAASAVKRARAKCNRARPGAHSAGRLRALSPRATLQRGYAIVRGGNQIVRSPSAVAAGDAIDIEVAEGRFGARVE